MIDARRIAELARDPTTSLDDAAAMIQRFADKAATDAAIKAVEEILQTAAQTPLIGEPSGK